MPRKKKSRQGQLLFPELNVHFLMVVRAGGVLQCAKPALIIKMKLTLTETRGWQISTAHTTSVEHLGTHL